MSDARSGYWAVMFATNITVMGVLVVLAIVVCVVWLFRNLR